MGGRYKRAIEKWRAEHVENERGTADPRIERQCLGAKNQSASARVKGLATSESGGLEVHKISQTCFKSCRPLPDKIK